MARQQISDNLTATIHTLKEWVEKNLSARITTRDIAAAAGYSSRHLYSGFVHVTGTGPARYARLRKLTQAAYLLYLTKLSVTEIAHRFAFSSLQCFSRAFRRHFGLSPLAYRKTGKLDIHLTVPVSINKIFRHTCHLVYRRGIWLHTLWEKKIILPVDNKIVLSDDGNFKESAYLFFYNRIFRHINKPQFTLLASVRADTRPALTVLVTAGSLSHTQKMNAVYISPSYWLRYSFTGSLKETMLFTQWVNNHGLKSTGLNVRLDQTLTSYLRHPGHRDKFSISYSLPCIHFNAIHDETAEHYWQYNEPYDLYFYDRDSPGSIAYPDPDRPEHSRRHDEACADEKQR